MTGGGVRQRVLVTGASGLLGTAIMERLRAGRDVLGLALAHAFPGTQRLDLLAPRAADRVDALPWDALVHCAAYRSPDFCEEHRDEARRFNAELPGELAAVAARRGARVIHISTDFVFDGTRPPYREDDPTGPVNWYGATKLQGEQAALAACPDALVLRVVALYGEPPAPVTAAMIEEGIEAATSSRPYPLDNRTARFPTHAADIAAVVAFVLDRHDRGILHASAPESTTRYGWAVEIARLLGRDSTHLLPLDGPPPGKARRPPNTQLATGRLAELGAPMPRGFRALLPAVLARRQTAAGR